MTKNNYEKSSDVMLSARNISVTLGGNKILRDVSLDLEAGRHLMVVGPNGSGKTTLVRAMMNAVPREGSVTFDGIELADMKETDRARKLGVLTQQNAFGFAFTAFECVAVGRYAHRKSPFDRLSKKDIQAVDEALEITRAAHLKNRLLPTLSGGETQRVYLARALAQEPSVLILDEPTNHLDIEHQILLFEIIKDWIGKDRRAVLSIVHDLNLAYTYGTDALLLYRGEVFARGAPKEVFSAENLKTVYNVDLVSWMRGLLSRWEGDQNEP